MSSSFDAYQKAVTYIESLAFVPKNDYMSIGTPAGRRNALKRFEVFLRRLGSPHRDMRYLHVGGTSGKGSTAAMLHSILTQAGIKAGLYTSPFVTTHIEKYTIGSNLLAPRDFTSIVERLKPTIDWMHTQSRWGHPSYFEICTAIAFLAFKQHRCRYAVLEVGLGGQYDATNVIPPPRVALLTHIDKDHTELLGNTLPQIAREKSGIIKRGSTVFFSPATKAVKQIIEQAGRRVGAKIQEVRPDRAYKLSLAGPAQQNNAALAAAAARQLGISETVISAGLRRAALPCRFEYMRKNPLLILDGAHNASKITNVARQMKNLTYKKLFLIIALTQNRQPLSVFRSLIPLADTTYVTRFESLARKPLPPTELADQLKRAFPPRRMRVTLDPEHALDQALRAAKPNDCILVTGSFFLAGQLRQRWVSEDRILRRRSWQS